MSPPLHACGTHRIAPASGVARHRALRVLFQAAALICVLAAGPARAAGPEPTVTDIELDGLVRIPADSVMAKIHTRKGAILEVAVVSDDIERLFEMGAFKDIRVAQRKVSDGEIVLRFLFVERPIINEIKYSGTDELDADDLKEVVDLQTYEVVDETKIKSVAGKIRDRYVKDGYYLARIDYHLAPRPGNAVDVVFDIVEGTKVKVTSISFLGVRQMTEDELEKVMETREGGWFSFLTGSGQFKKDALDKDLDRIRQYYLHNGFVDAKVYPPTVTLGDDKRSIDIVVPVDEGDSYTMRNVEADEVDPPLDAQGNPAPRYDKEYLRGQLTTVPGEKFDVLSVMRDTQKLKCLYQDLGYANVQISNTNFRDPENKQLDFGFKIQPGKKTFIGRINFIGNDTTRDKVMRRVMTLAEGDLFSCTGLESSRREISRQGFFDKVDISTEPGDDPEHMNLTVTVKERQTGTFQLGAGFSSLENFIFTAQVSKQNFLGHGQTVSIQATLSSIRSLYQLSFFDPYFLDSQWQLSVDFFNFQQDFTDFAKTETGGSLGWGYRFTEDLTLTLNYTLKNVEVTAGGINSGRVEIFDLQQGGLNSSLKTTLSLDTRDDRQFPKSGTYTTASFEAAHPYLGSEVEYLRLLGRARWYYNPWWQFVFKFNATLGYVWNPDGEIPIFERFFVGGIFDVRGFQRNSLGPSISVPRSGDPGTGLNDFTIGGNKQLVFNVELEFPIVEQINLRGVFFFDAGNAYGESENINFTTLRTSAGLGIRWWSPVGPLRFEWGFPLDPKPDEEKVVFEFTIGNSF
jgi:outer membrane protein insertion porin family